MASTKDNINTLENAEDMSQNSCSESYSQNSEPDLECNAGDECVTETSPSKREEISKADVVTEFSESNNANMGGTSIIKDACDNYCQPQVKEVIIPEAEPAPYDNTYGQVNYSFETDSDEDFCVLRRSRSDELLELKHHFQARECLGAMNDYPSPVSEINAKEYLELQKEYVKSCSAEQEFSSPDRAKYSYIGCRESPVEVSGESDRYARRRRNSSGSNCEERIRSIEEEYIQRIGQLEDRHYELEEVLARLTSSLEPLFESAAAEEFKPEDLADVYAACIDSDPDYPEDHAEEKEKIDELLRKTEQQKKRFARMIGLELFMEFQQKIRNFALELNGVLNCSEAALRHARVVQEWGTNVQLMFEEMKEDRMKMQEFIDERERSVMIMRNQFSSEIEQQGHILQDLVEDMKSYRDLYVTAEKYGGTVAPTVSKIQLAKNIVDLLIKQRVDGEKALVLDLKKQSKISEMKLLIIHQQSFLQQIQEQNRELRSIIEGLMGTEELDSRQFRSPGSVSSPERGSQRQSGTPGSISSPERGSYRSFCSPDRSSVRQSLERLLDTPFDPPVCKISDVLDCDRGETCPGTSTDGDIATIQTFGIGNDSKRVDPGKPVIYDPLSVSYIRDQCRAVAETERRYQMMQEQAEENKENIEADDGVPTFCDGVGAVNIGPYLRRSAEKDIGLNDIAESEQGTEIPVHVVRDKEAGGDGADREAGGDTGTVITNKASPRSKALDILAEYNDSEVDIEDVVVDECGLFDGIRVAEPPIIDIENTNNNDDLE